MTYTLWDKHYYRFRFLYTALNINPNLQDEYGYLLINKPLWLYITFNQNLYRGFYEGDKSHVQDWFLGVD